MRPLGLVSKLGVPMPALPVEVRAVSFNSPSSSVCACFCAAFLTGRASATDTIAVITAMAVKNDFIRASSGSTPDGLRFRVHGLNGLNSIRDVKALGSLQKPPVFLIFWWD